MTIGNWQAVGTGHETSVPWPTHAANDWGVLCVQWGGGSLTTPTDWTLIATDSISGGTESVSVFLRLATSGAMGNAALAGPSNHAWGVITTVRNVHQTLPVHTLSISTVLNSGTTMFYPAVVVDVDDVLVMNIHGWAVDSAGPIASAESNASLTGLTERYDAGTTTGNGGGVTIYSGTIAAPGTVSQTTATSTPVGVAMTIAFAPIADKTISGTVTIDASPAANGESVRALDLTQLAASYLCTVGTTGGGTGTFTISAPYDDHDYQAVYEDGASYGASAVDQAV